MGAAVPAQPPGGGNEVKYAASVERVSGARGRERAREGEGHALKWRQHKCQTRGKEGRQRKPVLGLFFFGSLHLPQSQFVGGMRRRGAGAPLPRAAPSPLLLPLFGFS